MSENAVEVRNVTKSFFLPHHKNNSLKSAITQIFKAKAKGGNTFSPLNGISFNVKKGDFFGVLGRNGSGKSTLLKIISEIYQPTSGTVRHEGKLVSFIELGVGFKAELSGRENVYLNGGLLGFSKKEVDEMYDDIVSFAELEEFMDQKLKNYSSGMKVRLAFSVAIRAKADVLILDEVLAVGDAEFQKKCNDYFKTLKNDGKTVILVTHSMTAVREYCNKALVIEDGKVIYAGDAETAADEYLKLFSGSSTRPQVGANRWGTKDVTIDDFKADIQKNAINITVRLKASNNPPEGDIVFGFRVKDQQGSVVAGANNLNVENPTKIKLKKNETKQVSFSMQNILGNGTYSLGATARLDDGLTILDAWENILSFSNRRAEVYYPIVCPAVLTVETGEDKE